MTEGKTISVPVSNAVNVIVGRTPLDLDGIDDGPIGTFAIYVDGLNIDEAGALLKTAKRDEAASPVSEVVTEASNNQELIEALRSARKTMRNVFSAISTNQVGDKDAVGQLRDGMSKVDAALFTLSGGNTQRTPTNG